MTAKLSPTTELMHAVLDGEASDGEARQLETLLAADPALRAEFDEWQRLFQALGEVAQEHVPEGLVAAVTAALPAADSARAAEASQPFSRRRVFGRTLSGFFRPGPQNSRAMKATSLASAPPTRSITMSDQSSRKTISHRKAWLGAGIAAAAAVVVAQFAFDFPIAKDVTGTVIPAQRYRAGQNGSEDVQVGAPGAPNAGARLGAAPEASRSVVEKTADLTAQKTADMTAQKTADLTAQKTADMTAQKTADLTAQKTADLTAQKTADMTAQKTVDMTAQKTADLTAQKTADLTAQKTADLTAQKTADLTAQKTADRTAQKTAEMTMQRNEAARLESQRTLEKSTNRSTQQ